MSLSRVVLPAVSMRAENLLPSERMRFVGECCQCCCDFVYAGDVGDCGSDFAAVFELADVGAGDDRVAEVRPR